MTHSTPPSGPRSDDLGPDGLAPTDADARLSAQLDAALAPPSLPAGLIDAVLATTRDHLAFGADGGADGDTPQVAKLDAALGPVEAPSGLADAVLAATRDLLPMGADDSARLEAGLDAALGPVAAPVGLADAVLEATRDHLPVATSDPLSDAPVGRIGFGRAGWMRALAAAALLAITAGAWWMAPFGNGPTTPSVAMNDTPGLTNGLATELPTGATPTPPVQTAATDEADLDPDAARLLEPFEVISSRLAQAVPTDDTAAGPVDLLGQRLVAVADTGPWDGAGFDGIDRAIDWEVAYATADDGAWMF